MIVRRIFDKTVLNPLSLLWDFSYRLRRSFYEYGVFKKNYFKVPIISVGNITFGGTGKTPMTIWLIQMLEENGLIPMVLTRGYKGDLEHSGGIIHGGQRFRSNPKEFGDEPLLISRKMNSGAVVIGKRRSENLKKFFHQVKPDVVILDDGFQHIQLYRSFNMVMFDASLPLSSYRTAPMGYLREGVTALRDADAILISRADQVTSEKIDQLLAFLSKYHRKDIPIAKFRYQPTQVLDCFDKKVMNLEDLKGKNVIALTAIASPESFYSLIESYGGIVVDKASFPDHYYFTLEDVNELLFKCSQLNAIILTSEKDIVKIKRVSQDPKINYIDIQVDFLSGKQELVSQIKNILKIR